MTESYRKLRDCDIDSIPYVLRHESAQFTGRSIPDSHELDSSVAKWTADTANIADRYLVNPLPLPGECGPVIRGVIVNHDTSVYQERINLMLSGGVLDKLDQIAEPVILEIGGGYGSIALALLRIFPKAKYTICDLPECLLFSGSYLALAGEMDRVSLVPNYLFESLVKPIDLVINTLSMAEMSVHQVRVYGEGISRLIGHHGVFFEQNQDNSTTPLGCPRPTLGNYPAAHLREYFSSCVVIPPMGGTTQGEPHLWTN